MDAAAGDAVAPTVTGLSLAGVPPAPQGANGAYIAGDAIEAAVTFSEPVTVDATGGTPRLLLAVGAYSRYADYESSGSGSARLVFRYAVGAGEVDADGIGVSEIALNGGTIGDAGGNAAALGLGVHAVARAADFPVNGNAADAVGPSVTGAAVSGTGRGAGGVFLAGDVLAVTLEFSEPVTVGGTPQVALGLTTTGGTPRADYFSGSGTASLVFRYTVAAGDADADGVSVGAAALALNGATIRDASGNAAALGLGAHAIADGDAVVNGGAADPAPTVTGLALAGVPPAPQGAGGAYRAGDAVEAAVTFSEAVTVTGTPQVALTIGTTDKQADYASGSGTATLRFRYAVVSGDADADGISVAATALALNGGTIQDLAPDGATPNDAALGLGTHAVANDSNFVVSGSAADGTGPRVVGLRLSGSGQGAGGAFIAGDRIEATVRFDEAALVTGPPQLALTVGANTRQAGYVSGTGDEELVFRYTVAAADADADGISVGASALALNGGTIRDAAGNAAALGLGAHAAADAAGFVVAGAAADAAAPTVTGVTVSGSGRGRNGVFIAGDALEITAAFSEPVTVTGNPQAVLAVGANTRRADYESSGSGTAAAVFRYTVVPADADADGIGVSALSLNGGRIEDASGNAAALALGDHAVTAAPNSVVDGSAADTLSPTVTGLTLAGVPPAPQGAGGTYRAGDEIEATVTFSEPVTVTGTPQLAFGIGADIRQVDYASGSGTAALVFRYQVVAGDTDGDGISVTASALTLNGGTIRDGAATPNDAALALGSHAISDNSDFPVNGAFVDSVGARVLSVTPTGTGSGPGGAFVAGDVIVWEVRFSEPVTVTGTGTPHLTVYFGADTLANQRRVRYSSGSGSALLRYRYAVASADEYAGGSMTWVLFQSATSWGIEDRAGNRGPSAQDLNYRPAGFLVDGDGADLAGPAVTGATLGGLAQGAGGVFIAGDAIEATLAFDEPVTVTGTPQVTLILASGARRADYSSGGGTSELVFRYTVVSGDSDPSGVSVGGSALSLNGGTLADASGNAAALSLGSHALTDDAGARVNGRGADARAPTVVGLAAGGTGTGPGGVFIAGDHLDLTVEFDEPVTVTGTPRVALTLASGTRYAAYHSGSGTSSPVFRYTVVRSDTDADGITVSASALESNGGTIRDLATPPNAASLGLGEHALAAGGPAVNGSAPEAVPPTVTGLSLGGLAQGANGVFIAGDRIEATVTFSEEVTVTGTPRLALTVGANTRQAAYASGSGTRDLVFAYAVAAGDADADGITVAASALALNGGTIADARDTDARLGLGTRTVTAGGPAVAGGGTDARRPAVAGARLGGRPEGANGRFIAGDDLEVTVEFDEPVTVTGTPRVALAVGAATRQAAYALGSGTASLVFRYTVAAGDADPNGVAVPASALTLGGGTIRDAAGNAAALALGAIPDAAGFPVAGANADAVAPVVTGVSLSSLRPPHFSAGVYGAYETIVVAVAFSEPVTVTGTPQVAITLGDTNPNNFRGTLPAPYASGSGGTTLRFHWDIPRGALFDFDGISIGASALTLNGGTIRDAANHAAALGLGAHAFTNRGDFSINANSQDPRRPSMTVKTPGGIPSGAGGVFTAGDALYWEIGFDEPVLVVGSPRYRFTLGGGTAREADYLSGSGSTLLRFRYVTQAADRYSSGTIPDTLVTDNANRIKDRETHQGGNDANPVGGAHSLPAGFRVDGSLADVVGPKVVGVTLGGTARGANGVFLRGDEIEATVEFHEPAAVTGTPRLALAVGSAVRHADYASGSGTTRLVFRYAVRASDADADGIGASALAPGGGTIADAAGNAASRGLGDHATEGGGPAVDGSLRDTVAPTVTGLTLAAGSPQGAAGAYIAGDVLEAAVTFSEPVTVAGAPQLTLTVGAAARAAAYASGGGTTSLVFRYAVVASDADADGIGVGASALGLNGGSIADRDGNAAALDLGTHAVANASGFVVNGSLSDTVRPTLTHIVPGGTPNGANGVFIAGDVIVWEARFSEPVTVAGSPRMTYRLSLDPPTRVAGYHSGSGTSRLRFRSTVQSGDSYSAGGPLVAEITASSTVRDRAGNAVDLLAGHRVERRGFHVDGTAADRVGPGVVGLTLGGTASGANGVFIAGDEIEATVEFHEAATVTGTPRLALAVGSAARRAAYASGSGTSSLVFRYTVAAGDADPNGIGVGASALALNGGSIADSTGNAAALGLGAHAITDGDLVVNGAGTDGTAPTVTGLTLSGSAPQGADGAYREGDRIEAAVAFSEPVTVTGTPQLALTVGALTRQAAYVSGSGTASLTFRYAVASGDSDSDGIGVGASALTLNGGSIADAAGNAAALGLGTHALTAAAAFPVNGSLSDTVAPTILSVTPGGFGNGAGGVFTAGDFIFWEVRFSEPVVLPRFGQGSFTFAFPNGVPRTAAFDYRTAPRRATDRYRYRYAVAAGDAYTGGTIRFDFSGLRGSDAAGNRVSTTGSPEIDLTGFRVDGAAADAAGPAVVSLHLDPYTTQGANGTYIAGDDITVRLEFHEPVTVTGTPQLALDIGSATRQVPLTAINSTRRWLRFSYVVRAEDSDADGISIGGSALTLDGGAITDGGGRAASLDLSRHAITDHPAVVVDGSGADATPPTISAQGFNWRASGRPNGAGGVYVAGDSFTFGYRFSEPVFVTGSPRVRLTVGSATRYADYAGGSGGEVVLFRYTVQAGDSDADGVSAHSWDPGSATIRDRGGHDVPALAPGVSGPIPAIIVNGAAADVRAPAVAGLTLGGIGQGANGVFVAGDLIEATVEFDEAVTVTGQARVVLTVGAASRPADYASGSGTTSLVFRYTVVAADADADGISATAITAASIADAAGNNAAVGLGAHAITDGGLVVNGGGADVLAPPVTGLALSGLANGANGAFIAGDILEATVDFREAVTVTGTPRLALSVGAATRYADYESSGGGTSSLLFRYLVAAADEDADGVTVAASALALAGGTIRDGAGNDAALDLGPHAVTAGGPAVDGGGADAAGPVVTGVAVSGDRQAVSSGVPVFTAGDRIVVTIAFNEAVTVTGTPQAALTVGASTRQAAYVSGSGTSSLEFRYTVAASDSDGNGVGVGASALSLNGGTLADAAGNAANLDLGAHAVSDLRGTVVLGGQGDSRRPAVIGLTLAGGAPGAQGANGKYIAGDALEVTVAFDEPVTVTGTPRVALGVGANTRHAAYASGSGTDSPVFRYEVVRADADPDGPSIGASALALNGGTIADAAGNAAALALGSHAVENAAGFVVKGSDPDTLAPTVAGVTVGGRAHGAGGVFLAGDEIEATVDFDQPVTVTGTPQAALTIGADTRQAGYVSGSGTSSLLFRYAVGAADRDRDGLAVGAGALSLNGGTLKDGAGNDALLGLGAHAVADGEGPAVDGGARDTVAPTVTGLTLASLAPAPQGAGGVHTTGDAIEATVEFSEAVLVTGTPRLAFFLTLGEIRQAPYVRGSGTTSLVFRYTVAAGDRDPDGVTIGGGALNLDDGTITDRVTHNARLPLPPGAAVDNDRRFRVDGSAADSVAPAVSGLALSGRADGAGGVFIAGDAIAATVEFTEPVTVTGTPRLALGVGRATRYAAYASGSGTRSLVFRYAVVREDYDRNGVSVGASALALNGGSIGDGTNAAALALGSGAVEDAAGFRVDSAAADRRGPAVVGLALSGNGRGAGGVFLAGDRIEATVEFDEPAAVTGAPRLALAVGANTRQAAYESGSGTTSLVFRYAVAADDRDDDGVSVPASALSLNGGSIEDSSGNDASLGLGAHAVEGGAVVGGLVVDGSARDRVVPTVTGLAISGRPQGSASGNPEFIAGDEIAVTVSFSEVVVVSGRPQVALTLVTGVRQARYAGGSGTSSLEFRYAVVAADAAANGIGIGASALTRNGGSIRDLADNPAALGLSRHAVAGDTRARVQGASPDTLGPAVTGVSLSGTGQAADGAFIAGDAIEATVEFHEEVTVAGGTPRLALAVGAAARRADYRASGSGTKRLTFRYAVAAGDRDADGIGVPASALTLPAGVTIRDAAGNAASLSLGAHAVANAAGFRVNGAAADRRGPAVTGLTVSGGASGANGVFIAGDAIEVAVAFDERVTVTGAPQVALEVGANTRPAAYASGSGTASLRFRYAAAAADEDPDGLTVLASALALNGGTIRDDAGNDAALGLGAHAVTAGGPAVDGDGADAAAPTVTGLAVGGVRQGSDAGGAHFAGGDRIEVTVEFSEPVTVTGTPRLALTVGANTRQADYASGSGTGALVFRYTVAGGTDPDSDADGLSVAASALALNDGTIADRAGNAAALGLGAHAVTNDGDSRVLGNSVDKQGPTVTGVSLSGTPNGARGVFIAGDGIAVTVEFHEAVTVTGTPRVALAVGRASRSAAYVSGGGTTALTFRYRVARGDADADGVGVSALSLAGGKITDGAAPPNPAALDLGAHAAANDPRFPVRGSAPDAVAPTVTGVRVAGAASGANGVFIAGDRIEVTVEFHEPVTVTGTPRLALAVGAAARQADYASGSGTRSLLFRYAVAAGDAAPDGITVGASALALNGGRIRDRAGNDAGIGLGAHAVASGGPVVTGAGTDAVAPTVTGLALSGRPQGDGGAYREGDAIEAAVSFSEPVTVTGTPRLALTVGTFTRQADYASGSGTSALVFRYTVVGGTAPDSDADGIGVAASALTLNEGSIADAAGNAAALGLGTHAVANAAAFRVAGAFPDSRAPAVVGVTLSGRAQGVLPFRGAGGGAGGLFVAGDALVVTVEFDEAVTVTGTPRVALAVGAATRQADYASGSGTTALAFRYAVAAADFDRDGVSVGASALALNGGSIADAAGNAAALGLGAHAVASDGDFPVNGAGADATGPTVTGVSLSGTGQGADGVFVAGDVIRATVSFHEPVTVTGAPQLALTVGAAARPAAYASGSGTASLVFRYTVVRADADADGITIAASALGLNGGTIRDRATPTPNAASLDLGAHAVTNDDDFEVDGDAADAVAPTVTGVVVSGDKQGVRATGPVFIAGDEIVVTVTFSEPVTVSGTPQVDLGFGGDTLAGYVSGSGTASLEFRYEVLAGDTQAGFTVGASALSLNGGTIADAHGNAAALGLGTVPGLHFVVPNLADGVGPTVAGLALSGSGRGAGGAFLAGDRIEAVVEFTEPVTVTGTPRLALVVGEDTRRAAYVSGSGTDSLRFRYAVVRGDEAPAGIEVPASALTPAGGTIADAAGNAAALDLGEHAVAADAAFVVDGAGADTRAPSVVGVRLSGAANGANGVFIAGDRLEVTVVFDEPVTVTGTPRVALTVGAATRYAAYVSGGGTTSPVFRYTVARADRDADGVSVGASALDLNGGKIADAANRAANLPLGTREIANDADFRVDGAAADAVGPVVTGVALSGRANGANGVFVAGDEIFAAVEFSEPVTVTGSPRLALTVGTATRHAGYVSGGGTRSPVFRYTVAAGDAAPSGLGVAASALALAGGTIADAAGHAAALSLGAHAITDDRRFVVDGAVADSVAPTVVGISLSGTGQGPGGVFVAGDVIFVTVEYSEAVLVAGAGPQVVLQVGPRSSDTRRAAYASGSGTASLVFRYRVGAGDRDADGVSVNPGGLGNLVATARIVDAAGNQAALTLGRTNSIVDDGDFIVDGGAADGVVPAVTGVSVGGTARGANGTFILDDVIEVTVEFHEAVTVTGTPQLALDIGGATRYANYALGSGTPSLVFRYTVFSTDADANGLGIGASALSLNGGTVADASGQAAALGLGDHAITDGDHPVDGGGTDGDAPTVTGLILSGNPQGARGVFRAGDAIEAAVTFNEPVTVTGTPRLALTIGTATRQANYASGSGARTLLFRYIVASGDADANGIGVSAAALTLNGGTIRDGANRDAALGLGTHAIANDGRVPVNAAAADAAPPRVTGTTFSGAGSLAVGAFGVGDTIDITIEFNEAVTVSSTTDVVVIAGSRTLGAPYLSGSGTTSLVYRYTVGYGHYDADGLSLTSLVAAYAAPRDSAGNRWHPDHQPETDYRIYNDSNFLVYGAGSYLMTGVSVTGAPQGAGGFYTAGDALEVTITYNRAVEVTGGTPQVPLTIGSATRHADYASGSGTSSLVFRYTVVAADRDLNGISLGERILDGIQIRGPDWNLRAYAFTDDPRLRVNGALPTWFRRRSSGRPPSGAAGGRAASSSPGKRSSGRWSSPSR